MNEAENSANQTQEGSAAAPICVRVFGRTDVGLVREHNEDNFLVADLSTHNRSIKPEVREHNIGTRGTLFVVCDGMGGAAAGEVASQLGVDTIYEVMQAAEPQASDEHLARLLVSSVIEAGVRIYTAARLNRRQRGMGTTVTAAVLNGPRLVMGQVGDSRAYIVRNGHISQVTKDQSLVQQLIDAKQITEEEARNFDRSNIILQALGTMEDVHVDITSVILRRGDALVMCSDGLSGIVPPDQILKTLTENDDPMEVCRILIEMACAGGGHDNITVIVSRFDGQGLLLPGKADVPTYNKFSYAGDTAQPAESISVDKQEEPSIRSIGETVEIEPPNQPAPTTPRTSVPPTSKASAKSQNLRVLIIGAVAGLLFGSGYIGYSFYSKNQLTKLNTIIRYESAATAQESDEGVGPNSASAGATSTNAMTPKPDATDAAPAKPEPSGSASTGAPLEELPGLAPTPEDALVSPQATPGKAKPRGPVAAGPRAPVKNGVGAKKSGQSTDKRVKLPDNPF
ncbi:MAG: Stp1/IreP family PP2C-type Ser/Thr phosphatase [Myxococcota bacterium]|jgi:protein phosphatase|nr:Stp1/IreP family PP2C-type Ser/Thr phosphatase [Myxococcota bacterium]